MNAWIVAGTDTGVGKTVVCAMLTLALDAHYWKPIQSGSQEGTDSERVAALTELNPERFFPERYVLREPLSPHRAAERDGLSIDPEALGLPDDAGGTRRLVIETAGGLLVPINREMLQIDLFHRWRAPVVLVARTSLGTINHSLLSLEALRRRRIKVLGVLFVGEAMPDTEQTILAFGGARHLGRLPYLPQLDRCGLERAFADHFRRQDFEADREI